MLTRRRILLMLWLCTPLALAMLAAASAEAAKAGVKKTPGKRRDLVVVGYERWLDTLKGTVKNFSTASARDVTVLVRFVDRKRKLLGIQRVTVGDLRSGDESAWSLPIQERNRSATHYQFEVHAIWQ